MKMSSSLPIPHRSQVNDRESDELLSLRSKNRELRELIVKLSSLAVRAMLENEKLGRISGSMRQTNETLNE
ncbi:hypothetical protein V1282_006196 [Nitrobacteraceae bacterium AZCC 2146]